MNLSAFLPTRLAALVRKEIRQMVRDRSNLAVGLLLPFALILLFGYGLSFDVTNAPVAVVMEDRSPTAREAVSGLEGSGYLSPLAASSMAEAEAMMRAGRVNGIVRVPADFSRLAASGGAPIQLVLNGVDSTTASTMEGYVTGALASAGLRRADRQGGKSAAAPGAVVLEQRMWFNEAGVSTWYLVPGLLALVMTLIGAFLTSLLVAREWERGTLESLFVTPVRPIEIVIAKLVPYFVIGAIDLALCLLAARFLFQVPMRGSLSVIIGTSLLYLLVSLALGLMISGVTRNQFQASQLALLASFMPALMLSGFVFDLRNMPVVVQVVSQVLPATHYMGMIKTLFLAGDNAAMVLKNSAILLGYAVVLIYGCARSLRKRLE